MPQDPRPSGTLDDEIDGYLSTLGPRPEVSLDSEIESFLTSLTRPTYASMADQITMKPTAPIAGTAAVPGGFGFAGTQPIAPAEPLPQASGAPQDLETRVTARQTPVTPQRPPQASGETTPLPPEQERSFRQWALASGITDVDHPDSHYDYRGLYLALRGQPVPAAEGRHFPDTFKQHGHPTFSIESQYSRGPNDGGRWMGDHFVPPGTTAPGGQTIVTPEGAVQLPANPADYLARPDESTEEESATARGLLATLTRPISAALGLVTGTLTNMPTAVGEQLAGQTLPGHEGETTLRDRLANHARMILSGRGGAVTPMGVPGAILNPPNSAVGPQTIITADGAAQIPTQVRSRSEMVALETGRRGLDMAAQLITDPTAIAAMGVPGKAGQVLATAFAVEGVTAAAQVVADPNSTAEDVAEAVVGATINAVPAAARIIRPKVEMVMRQARVRAAERVARERAAGQGFENARPVGKGTTPIAGGRLVEEPPPSSQGPPLAQEPPPVTPAAVRPGASEGVEPGGVPPTVPSPGVSPAAPATPTTPVQTGVNPQPEMPRGPVPTADPRDTTKYQKPALPGLYTGARVTHKPTGHTGTILEWFENADGTRTAFRVQWDTGDTSVVNQRTELEIGPPAEPAAVDQAIDSYIDTLPPERQSPEPPAEPVRQPLPETTPVGHTAVTDTEPAPVSPPLSAEDEADEILRELEAERTGASPEPTAENAPPPTTLDEEIDAALKELRHAVPIDRAEKVDARESPGDGEALGGGNASEREVAGAREEETARGKNADHAQTQTPVTPAPTSDLGPVPSGSVRLYRGGTGTSHGNWFTDNLEQAAVYAREHGDQGVIVAVDVPEAEAQRHANQMLAVDGVSGTAYRLPPEFVQQAKPVARPPTGSTPVTRAMTEPNAPATPVPNASTPVTPALSGPEPVVFRSGNQRAPSDLEGYIQAGQPVGITHDAVYQARARAAQYAQRGGHVFIDSGAFGNPSPDFPTVIQHYREFLDHVGREHAGNLHFVAPDKVGDPDATRALQAQHTAEITELLDAGAHVIVPVQVGAELANDAVDVARTWPQASIGLPGNKAAISDAQLQDLVHALVTRTGRAPGGFHFLGIGERNARFNQLAAIVRHAFPEVPITADSNRTQALMAAGRPAHTEVEEGAHRTAGLAAEEDAEDFLAPFLNGELDYFKDGELQRIATALSVTPAQLEAWATARELREHVTGAAARAALTEVMKARNLPTARSITRRDVIAKHDTPTEAAKQKAREERARLIAELKKRRGDDEPNYMRAPEDKVAKLLRLAASNPNPHEAAAAAKRAQELIDQYQLKGAGPLPPTTFAKLRDASFKLAEKILLAEAKRQPVSAEHRATDAALKARLDAAYTYLGRHPNAYDEPRFSRMVRQGGRPRGKWREAVQTSPLGPIFNSSKLTPEDLAALAADPAVRRLVDAARRAMDDVLRAFPAADTAIIKRGILFEPGAVGVYVADATAGQAEHGIYINPFEAARVHTVPDRAAGLLLNAILHEITHFTHRGTRGERFAYALGVNYGQLGADQIPVLKRLTAAYRGGGLSGLLNLNATRLAPDVAQAVLRLESLERQRGGARPDRGGAVRYIARPGDRPGDEGPDSEGTRPDRTGAVTKADVVALVNILDTYKAEGITDFATAVQQFQDDYGRRARDLDRAFEIGWRRKFGQDLRVADVLGKAQNTRQEPTHGTRPAGGSRDDAGSRQPAESGGPPVSPDRAEGEGALGAVSTDAVSGAEHPGAASAGSGDSSGVVADGVRDHAASGPAAEPPPDAGGGVVPGGTLSPSGAKSNPGPKPADYQLTPERIAAIVSRGPMQRVRDNIAVIQLLRQLKEESRYATADEQDLLAKWVGWGASDMAAFLADTPAWNWKPTEKAIWQQIRDITTPEERAALVRSTPNAHFTYDLYRPIWQALELHGFPGGRVLEPAVGTGHAFGFMPPHLRANATLAASELEPITAAIAQHLYPSARVQPVGYEQIRLPRNTQDLVISNVPFGPFGVEDKHFTGKAFLTDRVHNYFFAKALEHARPGGLVVFVTSRYTMDGQDNAQLRRYLMERAHFLGAIRLPNTAFDKSAKTEVVTDVIVLRKFAEGDTVAENAKAFIEAPKLEGLSLPPLKRRGRDEQDRTVYRSRWYEEHPELVLGKETRGGTMYGGGEYTVEAQTADVPAALGDALITILKPADYIPATTTATAAPTKVVHGTYKPGELRAGEKGRIERVERDGTVVDATPIRQGQIDRAAVARIVGMIKVRDALRTTVTALRTTSTSDADVEKAQKALTKAYDTFIKQHGHLNDLTNKRLFQADPESQNLLGLERLEPIATYHTDKHGKETLRVSYNVVGLADIFTKNLRDPAPPEHVDTPAEALVTSLGRSASIDWPYMARLFSEKATPAAIADLQAQLRTAGRVYEQPDGSWVLAEEYLSGDVVTKLADAEAAAEEAPAKWAKNVEDLTAIQPKPKTADEITITLGSHWVPPADVMAFASQELGLRGGVWASLQGAEAYMRWTTQFSSQAEAAGNQHRLAVPYGPRREDGSIRRLQTYGFTQLLDDALNLKTPELGWWEGSGDDRHWVKDPIGTEAARANLDEVRGAWLQWIAQHDDVQTRLVRSYNERFNRTVPRTYDGSHLANIIDWNAETKAGTRTAALPGLSLPFPLHPHQVNAIWRMLTTGNTLLAHEVGAGKTFEMIVAAMEMRRTGRARKPMITVPTYLLSAWRDAITEAYPNAKVLAFEEKDLEAKKRQQAMARIAFGDWDIVLVPHSSFQLLKVSNQRMADTMQRWIDEILDAENEARGARGSRDPSVKQLEAARRRIEDKVRKKLAAVNKGEDNGLTWEQLGVDALFVDEAHAFKNLYYFSKIESLRGLSRSEADKSLDLYVKVQDLNEASHYRNLVLATATPVMNSIAEVFTVQRYLQPQRLRQAGLENFDNWYAMFAHASPGTEQRPDGTYQEVMRLRDFQNLKFLHGLVAEVMDYVGWDDMPYLQLPKLRGGKVNIIQTEPHPIYARLKEWFSERLAELRSNPPHYNHMTGVYSAPERMHPLTGQPMGRLDNILTVMTDAKLAAIDPRLVLGPIVKDVKGSRLQTTVRAMMEVYKAEAKRKGVTLIFLDAGTPKTSEPLEFLKHVKVEDATEGEALGVEDELLEDEVLGEDQQRGQFNMYEAVKAALVAAGVPSREIAFGHQAKTGAERLALFQAAREGRIRFLLASTEKGGVGMNIQTRLAHVLHFDAPAKQRPGDIRQRDGRGIRQGNTYKEILISRAVTKGSTDEWLYGLLGAKQNAITQFMQGNLDSYKDEDPSTMSIQEAQARASGDPRGIELTDLRASLRRLEAQAAGAERSMAQARADVVTAGNTIQQNESDKVALEAWLPHAVETRGDAFSMKVGDLTLTKRSDANMAILAKLRELAAGKPGAAPTTIGELGGLPVQAQLKQTYLNKTGLSVRVTLDTSVFGQGDLYVADVDVPDGGADKLPELGAGRDVVSSLVANYQDLPTRVPRYSKAIEEATDKRTRAQALLERPSDAIERLRKTRARITALEEELKTEGAAKDAAMTAQRQQPPAAGQPAMPAASLDRAAFVEEMRRRFGKYLQDDGAALARDLPPPSSGGGGGVQAAVIPGLKEFVEQDVTPALKDAAAQAGAVKRDIRALFAPDTVSPPATRFAGTMRANLAAHAQRNQRARRILRDLEKAFDKRSNDENVAFIDAIESGDLDAIPADVRPGAELLRDVLDRKRREVQKRGRLRQYIEHYFPHEWKEPGAATQLLDRLFFRKPLQGSKNFLKKRSIPTVREGLALGLEPVSYNPVTLVLRKLVEMDKWIMAFDILHDARAQGVAKFVRIGGDRPEGWVRYHESFGTVYGEPVVKVREAYDAKVMHGLYALLRDLGVTHVRKVALGGQRWGYAVGTDHVTTKFAGPEGVLMHELGHILDDRYGLRDKWVNDPKMRKELRDLADLRHEGTKREDLPISRQRYYRKGEEKIANLVHAFLYMPDRAKQVAPNAYWALYNLAKANPELRPLLDLQKARSLTFDTGTAKVPVGGLVVRGHYYGPPEATRLLNNYLSPGLRSNAAFNAYRRAGNFMNQVQLGISAFHLTMTGAEAMVSHLAMALQEASRGVALGLQGEGARSVVELLHAGKHVAETPVATMLDLFRGHKALQEFFAKDANGRLVADTVDKIIQGGGGVGWDQFHHDDIVESFMRALRQGNVWGAAWRTVPMVFAALQKPIMDWWVPRLKLGAYLDLAAMELRTLGPDPDITEVRRVLGDVWDSIDNRFGELRYDNLFWHNTQKDLGMASVRALGWNVGTVREVFGAPSRQARHFWQRPHRQRQTGYDAGGEREFEDEADPWLTHKAAYVVAMVMLYGLWGALYQLAHTGQWPDESRDYFFPKTGHKKADGTPERVSIPGYFKDAWAVLHDLPGSAVTTAGHKLHPLLNALYEMFTNEDYFGTEIRNPDDPLVQQAKELFAHLLRNLTPISIQSYQRRKESRTGTGISGVESFFGINEAPASVYRTAAEKVMRAYAPPSTHTQEQAADRLATRDLRDALRRGDRDAAAEAARRGLSKRQIEEAVRTRNLTPLQRGFRHLTVEQALHVYEVATPAERADLYPLLQGKAANAFENGGLLPAEQADVVQRLRKAVALPRARKAPPAAGQTPVTGAR